MLIKGIHRFRIEFAAAAIVILVLSCVLMPRPVTGIADNGDFARIMNSTGLSYLTALPEDRYFGFVNRLYASGYIIPFGGGYISTQIPLVLLAVYISKTIAGTSFFDIRYLGTLFILIFAAATFLVVAGVRKRKYFAGLFISIASVIIFCDLGYTAYFNSLYGEPVSFVFLLLMAGAALTLAYCEKPAIWMLAVFCTAALFFAGAKVQNSPAGLMAALLCIRLAWRRKDAAWKYIAFSSAFLIAAVSLLCYASVSYEIKVCNKYQSVFYGVLKGSPDPAGDLRGLGLDPALSVLAGTNYFLDKYPVDIRTPGFKKMIYENVNYMKIAGFYTKHPGRLLQKLEYAAENGFKLKQGFGNYEKYPGISYKQTSNALSLWSDFKMKVLPHSLPFVAAFFAVVMLSLIYEYRRAVNRGNTGVRFMTEFFCFVAAVGIMQFILPIVADGEADISKHLFLFNISFDMLFTAGLTYLAVKAAAAVQYFKVRRIEEKLPAEDDKLQTE